MHEHRLIVNFAFSGIDHFRMEPQLHVRWHGNASELALFPEVRNASPTELVVATGHEDPLIFSFDHTGLDEGGVDLAVTFQERASDGVITLWYRSGTLTALPAPDNENGVFLITIAPALSFTVLAINDAIAQRFSADGPIVDGSITITGISFAPNPNNPTTLLMTASGRHDGPTPVPPPPALAGMQTVTLRYSAEVSFQPGTDVFDVTQIVRAVVTNPSLDFFGLTGNLVVGITSNFHAAFMNLLSPVIELAMHSHVERVIENEIVKEARQRVAAELGLQGELRPDITFTAQRATITGDTLAFNVALGTIGPLRPTESTGGCASTVLLLAGFTLAAEELIRRLVS